MDWQATWESENLSCRILNFQIVLGLINRIEMLYFLHIPKTAGSTLNYIIKNNYGGKAKEIRWHWTTWISQEALKNKLNDASLEKRDLIHGHFVFGIHNFYDHPGSKYLTFVRDPFKKAVSGFQHVKRDPKAEHHDVYKKKNLDHYLFDKNVVENDNGLVRRLAGIGNEVPYGNVERSHLQQAIKNIETYFLGVGITEEFDLSVEWFKRLGVFKTVYYWKQNITKSKTKYDRPSDEIIRKFKELNTLDFELYQYCVEQFRRKTSDINFSQDAFTFKNNLYNARLIPIKVIRKVFRFFKF